MNVPKTFALAVASMTALAMAVSLAAPAGASTAMFSDRPNDARPNFDITHVRVDNGKRIVVTVTVDQLRRDTRAGLGVYFDTRGRDSGPEYLAGGQLAAEREWNAFRIENWKRANSSLLLRCDINMRVNHQTDRATFDIARSCFKRPGRIRVAAVVTGPRGQDKDWAPQRHQFYGWVSR